MFAIGAWEQGKSRRNVCKMFLVPKKNSDGTMGLRCVLDLRPLNEYCIADPTKYETLQQLRQMGLVPDSLMISWDISDGYYCLSLAEEYRDFFTFELPDGQLVRYAGLPMGWNQSAHVFTSLMKVMCREIRSPGLPTGPNLMKAHQ